MSTFALKVEKSTHCYPVLMSNFHKIWATVLGSSFCITFNFLIKKVITNIKKLIMMKKLKPETVGVNPLELDMWAGYLLHSCVVTQREWLCFLTSLEVSTFFVFL